jgi:GTP-binding protein Era
LARSGSSRKAAPSGEFRSGYVSLTGKPNVGKSTFLNSVLREKVSIVTSKAQTTRNRIVGIKTLENAQIIFLDTPGIHRPRHKLGSRMVSEAKRAIKDVDTVLFMVEPCPPADEDRAIIRLFRHINKPVFLLVNKTDKVKKPALLPVIEEYSKLYGFDEVMPISALKGEGMDVVLDRVVAFLPPGPKYYPDDMVTDMLERFMVAEIVREKVIRLTGDEVPHSTAVEVTDWDEKESGGIYIGADIYIEKEGQKGIIIGKHGQKLKQIGSAARLDIQRLLGVKIFIDLWVKVKKKWRADETVLRDLGF